MKLSCKEIFFQHEDRSKGDGKFRKTGSERGRERFTERQESELNLEAQREYQQSTKYDTHIEHHEVKLTELGRTKTCITTNFHSLNKFYLYTRNLGFAWIKKEWDLEGVNKQFLQSPAVL